MKMKLMVSTALLFILLSGCAPALSVGAVPALQATAQPAVANVLPVDNLTSSNPLVALQSTFHQIYASVDPSVVFIQVVQTSGFQTSSAEGSGFVWDSAGHIVTNNHVIAGASQITVTFSNGTTVPAVLVGADPQSDLAVIQVKVDGSILHPVSLADSSAVRVGDLAIAIGNPYGLEGTMTEGIISALSRSLPVNSSNSLSTGTYTIPDIIQTDAAINPGNSGGVLVNANGQVIGVTAAISSASGSNSGIGFVIPANIVQKVVPVLIQSGSYQHPHLGISGASLSPDLAAQIGLPADQQGALVIDVAPNGPAAKAGLIGSTRQQSQTGQVTVSGGDVITAVNGQAVHSFDDLVSYIFNHTQVGQTVTLTLLRQGRQQTVDLTLSAVSLGS